MLHCFCTKDLSLWWILVFKGVGSPWILEDGLYVHSLDSVHRLP